ncbi:rhomboid family intramembrane serine protease [Patiriisocius marinus]|uniref:Rhomboid family intramembrane serine protease n=1 Tax=Patiriisocius marinus TaxID=1397112 RepID=A0A5J4IZM7_9FLAO|nr:rhomboid family intramembrane serine protease [Patiriisocius marinus]GER59078.1 rhomboid family intramembrane serine protease [Patiriisocius marinus]
MLNMNIATIVIIVANVLISIKGFNDFEFFEKYKFNVGAIKRGEQIRMITSGFLHANFNHLLFNMLTLFFFAPIVIAYLGTVIFVIIYLASLALGSIVSLYFHQKEYNYSAIGASGAVMGILYSAILFEPMMRINFIIPAWVFGIGYLGYSVWAMKQNSDNVGHDAHIGGAIGGYILTIAFAPSLLQTSLWLVGVLALPVIVLFVMHKSGKI